MKIRLGPRRVPSNEDLRFARLLGEARRRLRENAKAGAEASGATDSTPVAQPVSDQELMKELSSADTVD